MVVFTWQPGMPWLLLPHEALHSKHPIFSSCYYPSRDRLSAFRYGVWSRPCMLISLSYHISVIYDLQVLFTSESEIEFLKTSIAEHFKPLLSLTWTQCAASLWFGWESSGVHMEYGGTDSGKVPLLLLTETVAVPQAGQSSSWTCLITVLVLLVTDL